ncbi:hypothetical protein FA95DRAFT_1684268 [Auriscalpium vulgare]|uniref:Uncharacterized protein n=1 Tax=Auriscalpium vulgare TaxID=40419 RepID=A0ACB8R5T5_9AGAM|nr:hypothetical protein FA95DRAFT_1684268 [Auriscalpium vulgare]
MLSPVRTGALRAPRLVRAIAAQPAFPVPSSASESRPPRRSSPSEQPKRPYDPQYSPRVTTVFDQRPYMPPDPAVLRRSIFLRVSLGISSIADAMTLTRAVERKYGAVSEIVFPRDPDFVSRYQPFFWVVFQDAAVREQFPAGEWTTIQVRLPPTQLGDGGLGLDVLQDIMAPTNREPDVDLLEGPEEWPVAEVRIGHAKSIPMFGQPSYDYKKYKERMAEAWTKWGGFSTRSPGQLPEPHADAVDLAPSPNLHAVTQKWAKVHSRKSRPPATVDEVNDADTVIQQELDTQPTDEWVPLPDTSSTPDEPVPAPEPSAPEEERGPPVATKLSRRERILMLARQNARTPLPKREDPPAAPAASPTPELQEAAEEAAEAKKSQTIRERLLKLVGRGHF